MLSFNQEASKCTFVQEKIKSLSPPLSIEESNTIFPDAVNAAKEDPLTLNGKWHLQGIENIPRKKSLRKATFSSCTLSNSALRNTTLAEATIDSATLCLIDLSQILGKKLSIHQSDLFCINFSHSDLQKAVFAGNLAWLFFMGADLKEANFTHAQVGKGVFLIGAHTKNIQGLSSGLITSTNKLENRITQGEFTSEELTFLQTCFQSAAKTMRTDLSASEYLKPSHLTASHVDQVERSLEILDQALKKTFKMKMHP